MVFRVSILILKLKKQEISNKDSENVKGCSGNMTSLLFPILFTQSVLSMCFACVQCVCVWMGTHFPAVGSSFGFMWKLYIETLSSCLHDALWSMSIMSHQALYQHLMRQIKLQRKLMPSSRFENVKMPQILKCCPSQWSVAWKQSRVRSRHKNYQVVRVRKRLGIKYLWEMTWCLVKNIQ